MSFIKILIHSVWGTKHRNALLTESLSPVLYNHIREYAYKKGIYIDTINGGNDHVHCLFFLPSNLEISKAMHLIKGESSFWINKEKLAPTKFQWADEFYAVSVGACEIERVRQYIIDQKKHHEKKGINEIYKEFLEYYKNMFGS